MICGFVYEVFMKCLSLVYKIGPSLMQEGHEHKVTFNVYRVLGQPCVTFHLDGALKKNAQYEPLFIKGIPALSH